MSGMDVDASGNVTTYRRNLVNASWSGIADLSTTAPSGSTRNIKTLNIKNSNTVGNVTATVLHTDGTTTVELVRVVIQPQQTLQYVEGIGWSLAQQGTPAVFGMLIQEIVLSVDTPTIDFQNIPQTYRHLLLEYQARTAVTGLASSDACLQCNGDASASYDAQRQVTADTGVTATSSVGTPVALPLLAQVSAPNALANFMSIGRIDIPYYTRSFFKQIMAQWTGNRGASSFLQEGITNIQYRSTNPITRITLFPHSSGSYNWLAGSAFTLYGLI